MRKLSSSSSHSSLAIFVCLQSVCRPRPHINTELKLRYDPKTEWIPRTEGRSLELMKMVVVGVWLETEGRANLEKFFFRSVKRISFNLFG
jgi:hypothetical protein